MSHSNKARIAILFLCLSFLSSCAGIPVQEMSDARQAIQAAKEAGVKPDSQANLFKAEQHLEEAKQALDQGEYKKARKSAEAAKLEAIEAQKTTLTTNN